MKGWPGFSPGLFDRSHGGSRAREEDALELFLRHDRLRFVMFVVRPERALEDSRHRE